MLPITTGELTHLVRAALSEDGAGMDVTTLATIPEGTTARARMSPRESVVVAGLELAFAVFQGVSPEIEITQAVPDGSSLPAGSTLAVLEGPARALLSGERVALNCLQRLSGIATLTAAFVRAIEGTHARILDTRKTTPLWRRLEKYAVTCGEGVNHRQRLDDLVLIKDNHLAALKNATPNPIAAAVRRAKELHPYLKIEVEADNLEQVRQVIEAGADIVLLDNMSLEELREAVALCHGRILTEASGGIGLASVRSVAETGVDFLSVGALTHGARWVDIGLDFET